MHELSLVMGIIDLASEEAGKQQASAVEQIVLDIGVLSGVEMDSFEFAWNQAVKGTILDGTERMIHRIPGRGRCLDCETEFPLRQYYDPCPNCGEHLIQVISGKEMRVKTLTLRITDAVYPAEDGSIRIEERNPPSAIRNPQSYIINNSIK